MFPPSYLQRLTSRLADGLVTLSSERRHRHIQFLQSAQNADGGFSGREGGSDLYYTGFALRGLAALDALSTDIAQRAALFVQEKMTQQTTVVDFYSFLYSCVLIQMSGGPDVLANSPEDWPERVAAALESFRAADGGFAKSPGYPTSSTYHTFLVGLCYELLGRSIPRPEEVAKVVASRQREDGGYVEIGAMRRSGTNPTAAAIGILQLLEQSAGIQGLTPDVRNAVIDFLLTMPSDEGGVRANGRIPLADLLSTFTAIWTLDQLGGLDRIDTAAALRYGNAVESDPGGFRGGLWDDATDVEYTFYGLGVLALLGPR